MGNKIGVVGKTFNFRCGENAIYKLHFVRREAVTWVEPEAVAVSSFTTDHRKTPRITHGEESNDEARTSREPRRDADEPPVDLRDDLNDRGDERRKRIDLLGENGGDTIEQHISQHAAPDRGCCAKNDCSLDVRAVRECLVGTNDGEEA